MRFQDIASRALKAQYGASNVFDGSPSLKLATAVVNRNSIFSDDVRRLGHTKEFTTEPEDASSSDVGDLKFSRLNLEDRAESQAEKYVQLHPEIEDIVDLDIEVSEPECGNILDWLQSVYRSSRGFELGTVDAELLEIIWKKQSASWDKLTRGYISDIICLVHAFTSDLLTFICPDQRVRTGLTSVLMDSLLERYQRAIHHGNFILTVEREGNPQTLNHYFSDNLEKRYVHIIDLNTSYCG